MNLLQADPSQSIEGLRLHLQYAIGLELTTIPPYLCALYSIVEGENSEAVEAIQSVVLEEMLHMSLAANVLNAIGGVPSPDPGPGLGGISPIPVYPTKVPFIERIPELHLLPFSPEAVDTFVAIEQPLEPHPPTAGQEQYDSIGAFYQAIERGLQEVGTEEVFAAARVSRAGCQVSPHLYYGGGGSVIEVDNLADALRALDQIVRQGEGVSPEILTQTVIKHVAPVLGALGNRPVEDGDELPYGWRPYSHYARFTEIREGRHYRPTQQVEETPAGDVLAVEWDAALPMTPDPKAEHYDGAYRAAMTAFDQTYSALVNTLYHSFNRHPEALEAAVLAMYDLKYQAIALMQTPSPLDPRLTLGPGFQYLRSAPPLSRNTRAWREATAR